MLTRKFLFNWNKVFAKSYCRIYASNKTTKTTSAIFFSELKYTLYARYRNCSLKTVCSTHEEMTGHAGAFKLTDYDCVGFDLDNTLCRYNANSMMKMEYEVLSNFLVKHKGYNGRYLLKPIENDLGYVRKGLMLDFENGNVLQFGKDGKVFRACHGTRLMTNELMEYYGLERKCSLAAEFCHDLIGAWNGPLSLRSRTLLDIFDMPASLAFARIIDTLDECEDGKIKKYNVWPDVLDGLTYMYRRENLAAKAGGFFPIIKADPGEYIYRCNDNVLSWLKSVKENAKTFLLTGSNVDFASFVARCALGENWLDYFDIVVCYARKPGFFTTSRQFFSLCEFKEVMPANASDMQLNCMYSQGNWLELLNFFSKTTGKKNPKCLYIGDNLIQDIYVPSKYTNLDTVAVVDELLAEQKQATENEPWISYFGSGKDEPSLWSDIIYTHSKICVPNVDTLAEYPIDHTWSSFNSNNASNGKQAGFHPCWPKNYL